ncbi:sialate O-acetylesterase [Emticicia fontis]
MQKAYRFFTLSLGLMLNIFAAFSQGTPATNPEISWPVDYAVFQRTTTSAGTGGSANVTIAGQIYNNSVMTYKIQPLDLTGAPTATPATEYNITTSSGHHVQNLGTSTSSIFYFTVSVNTGWYLLTIKDGSNRTTSKKFGVGEVFVIAGQSNAQGVNTGPTNVSATISNYDCVVACKNQEMAVNNGTGNYSSIGLPVMGPLNNSNPILAPNGNRPWFYQSLGNQIATREAGKIIPVAFFNTAVGETSIDNWKNSMDRTKSMFSSNYTNPMVPGTTVNQMRPWGHDIDDRYPYINLKNVLSFYGNLFGVRAVLWHQGESETKNLLSKIRPNEFAAIVWDASANSGTGGQSISYYSGYDITTYATKLNALITETRSYLPNLPWAICKVSLTSETKVSNNTLYTNITNNSGTLYVPGIGNSSTGSSVIEQQTSVLGTSNVSWASQNSDTYNNPTYRISDGTHLNETGLASIANEIAGNMTNTDNVSGILNKPAIPPKPIMKITLSRTGAYTYNVTASNTTTPVYFRWVYSNIFQPVSFNQQWSSGTSTYTIQAPSSYMCYGKDAAGNIYISPYFWPAAGTGARVGVSSENINNSSAYPNPIEENKVLTIAFNLEKESPVKLIIYTNKNEILEEISEDKVSAGVQNFSIPLQSLKLQKDFEFIYYRLITNSHNETKKILITK